ncbi:unnamed protein product, partial [Laminaria digitata]
SGIWTQCEETPFSGGETVCCKPFAAPCDSDDACCSGFCESKYTRCADATTAISPPSSAGEEGAAEAGTPIAATPPPPPPLHPAGQFALSPEETVVSAGDGDGGGGGGGGDDDDDDFGGGDSSDGGGGDDDDDDCGGGDGDDGDADDDDGYDDDDDDNHDDDEYDDDDDEYDDDDDDDLASINGGSVGDGSSGSSGSSGGASSSSSTGSTSSGGGGGGGGGDGGGGGGGGGDGGGGGGGGRDGCVPEYPLGTIETMATSDARIEAVAIDSQGNVFYSLGVEKGVGAAIRRASTGSADASVTTGVNDALVYMGPGAILALAVDADDNVVFSMDDSFSETGALFLLKMERGAAPVFEETSTGYSTDDSSTPGGYSGETGRAVRLASDLGPFLPGVAVCPVTGDLYVARGHSGLIRLVRNADGSVEQKVR